MALAMPGLSFPAHEFPAAALGWIGSERPHDSPARRAGVRRCDPVCPVRAMVGRAKWENHLRLPPAVAPADGMPAECRAADHLGRGAAALRRPLPAAEPSRIVRHGPGDDS